LSQYADFTIGEHDHPAGKENFARSIVYGTTEHVSEKLGKGDTIDLLLGAFKNSRPKVEVKSCRIGGATYQIPGEIPYEHQHSLVFR
jgi:small subunit ribosomal protein S7